MSDFVTSFVPGMDFIPSASDVLGSLVGADQAASQAAAQADAAAANPDLYNTANLTDGNIGATNNIDTTGSMYGSGTATDTTGGGISTAAGQGTPGTSTEYTGGGYSPTSSIGNTLANTAAKTLTNAVTSAGLGALTGSGTANTAATTGTGTPNLIGSGNSPFGNLTAGLTSKGSNITLPGESSFTPVVYNSDVPVGYAEGSSVDSPDNTTAAPAATAPNQNALNMYSGPYNRQLNALRGQQMHGSHVPSLLPPTPNFVALPHLADGGHVPEFYSEGGLKHTYVQGEGDGTSDSVPAMLATGEFVIPADVVSSLGNGSNDSGSKVLDEFLSTIRKHKQEHEPSQLPPDSKGVLTYLEIAHKKAGA